MPNPRTFRPSVRKTPQPKEHRYIEALFSDDFGRMSQLAIHSAKSFAAKKLDAASQSVQLRAERNEKKARRIEIREWRAAEASVAAELRDGDRRIRLMWRHLKTKVKPEQKTRHTPPKERKRHWPYASVALPKYDGPVIDRNGHRGIFARFRYYSRKTAKAGVSQRVVRYCYNGAELDANGNPFVATNVGTTIDEALCAFDHLEQVNSAAQSNAKLLMHGIFAVDYRQSPDEMMTCGVRWAEETLARFDLPYLVTLHAPPPDGDERNWHLHVLWSFRPMVRTGDHEWQVGEMLRTDLDNPAAMKVMREMYAVVMTEVSFEAGQRQVYTAKSNADRGLVHEPQEHLGALLTNRAREGEHVARNEENHERVIRSKAAVLDDDLRHADEALAREQRQQQSILARWARLPAVPAQLPERFVAAILVGHFPEVRPVPPYSNAPIVVPAILPPLPSRPALPLGNLDRSEGPAGLPLSPAAPVPAPVPLPPTQVTVPHFANLRIRLAPLAPKLPPSPAHLPSAPAVTTVPLFTGVAIPVRPSTLPVPLLRSSALDQLKPVPPLPRGGLAQAAPMPPIASVPPGPPPVPSVTVDTIVRVRAQVSNALDREEERRGREEADAERTRMAAAENEAAAQRRRLSLDRLLQAIASDRHRVSLDKEGRYTIEPSLLERYGLSGGDLGDTPVQQQLAGISNQQNGEIARIATYVAGSPNEIRHAGGRWTLDDEAPDDIRALVDAWRGNRLVQQALGRVAKNAPKVAVPAGVRTNEAAVKVPGSAWSRARQYRGAAMRAWDDVERLDGGGMLTPGRQMERPGVPRGSSPSIISDAAPAAARVPPSSEFGR